MSDGPHRSLPMNKCWKRAAEHAENSDISTEFMTSMLADAIATDLEEMLPPQLKLLVRGMAGDAHPELACTSDMTIRQMYQAAAGQPLSLLVVQHIESTSLSSGFSSDSARVGLAAACADWLSSHARQMEEHYIRHRRGSMVAARKVRASLEGNCQYLDFDRVASSILGVKRYPRRTKMTELDDLAP